MNGETFNKLLDELDGNSLETLKQKNAKYASLLGQMTDASVEYGTDLNDISTPIGSLGVLETSFECVAKMTKDFLLAITGMTEAIINCCPDRRVAHLAVNGKTARIRKKNINRAIKILEDLDD